MTTKPDKQKLIVQIPSGPNDDPSKIRAAVLAIAEACRENHTYRKGTQIVCPNQYRKKLNVLDHRELSAHMNAFLCGSRAMKIHKESVSIVRDIQHWLVARVLHCPEFRTALLEVQVSYPAPLPIVRDDQLSIMDEGYDALTKSFTFGL